MQEMMRQMEGLADNSDFQNMLEGMMSQLMSKELLYEPMKDLAAKVSDDLQFQNRFLNNH
jgi:peroxin-19